MKKILFLVLLLMFAACVQSPKKKDSSYLKHIKTVPLDSSRSRKTRCQLAREGASWQKVMKTASRCLEEKNWNLLDQNAEYLRYYHPDAAWGFFYQSFVALNSKNYNQAKWMIERAKELAGEQEMILYQLANIHWQEKNMGLSVLYMEKVLAINPSRKEAHLFLARVQLSVLNIEKAREHLKKINDPNWKKKDVEQLVTLIRKAKNGSQLSLLKQEMAHE